MARMSTWSSLTRTKRARSMETARQMNRTRTVNLSLRRGSQLLAPLRGAPLQASSPLPRPRRSPQGRARSARARPRHRSAHPLLPKSNNPHRLRKSAPRSPRLSPRDPTSLPVERARHLNPRSSKPRHPKQRKSPKRMKTSLRVGRGFDVSRRSYRISNRSPQLSSKLSSNRLSRRRLHESNL